MRERVQGGLRHGRRSFDVRGAVAWGWGLEQGGTHSGELAVEILLVWRRHAQLRLESPLGPAPLHKAVQGADDACARGADRKERVHGDHAQRDECEGLAGPADVKAYVERDERELCVCV